MSEYDETVQMANRILDRPYADPDDDLAMLSRQFLRALERCNALQAQLNRLIGACYYRTRAGKVHWVVGHSYGTSVASSDTSEAYEEAIAAIRRIAGISELSEPGREGR